MVNPARSGFFFVRIGGTEYIPPRNNPKQYSWNNKGGKNLCLGKNNNTEGEAVQWTRGVSKN